MQELKANPNRYASGTVIESRIDKALGVVSTVLIQNGTLRLGDAVVVGNYAGKIRTLKNDKGEKDFQLNAAAIVRLGLPPSYAERSKGG